MITYILTIVFYITSDKKKNQILECGKDFAFLERKAKLYIQGVSDHSSILFISTGKDPIKNMFRPKLWGLKRSFCLEHRRRQHIFISFRIVSKFNALFVSETPLF